jgi:23S rRNA pseudouridine955/2504/2580 synthase
VIFENDDIIAINKPSGIAVHKGSGLNFGVIEAFRQIDPQQPLELVHRLDRETSGCLLLAKNRQILAQLHEMFRHEKTVHIEKIYIALLDGSWPNGRKTIDTGISKVKRSGEHMMQVDDSGDRAISHFEPLEIFDVGISPSMQPDESDYRDRPYTPDTCPCATQRSCDYR